MAKPSVGILGATSFVGETLLNLLQPADCRMLACSRNPPPANSASLQWLDVNKPADFNQVIPLWICVAPIWVLPDYFQLLEQTQARRIVAVSSTSRFTKTRSSDLGEQELAKKLIDAEAQFQSWAEQRGIEWFILRPTLIYGYGKDRNISEMARFIKRFGFFPVFGKAAGLRQPIHVHDVAATAVQLLMTNKLKNKAYNISGAEILSYREMVLKIFAVLNRQPRLISVPIGIFKLALSILRFLPRFRHWTAAMAERMNQNLVFDHSEAGRDLDFVPQGFSLSEADLPK